MLDERGHVGADEHLTVANADHQRCRPARGDDGVGVVGMGEDQGERALEPAQHGVGAGDEITGGLSRGVGALQRVDGRLGIGVGVEVDAQ